MTDLILLSMFLLMMGGLVVHPKTPAFPRFLAILLVIVLVFMLMAEYLKINKL